MHVHSNTETTFTRTTHAHTEAQAGTTRAEFAIRAPLHQRGDGGQERGDEDGRQHGQEVAGGGKVVDASGRGIQREAVGARGEADARVGAAIEEDHLSIKTPRPPLSVRVERDGRRGKEGGRCGKEGVGKKGSE